MTATAADAAALEPQRNRREARRVILSSYLGSTIEFYDFLLYGTAAALVFPQIFFTGNDPLIKLTLSFGTFAAGYLARPLGGAIFGHFGDRIGRKRMLVLSMMVMGLASACIGLVPDASVIGPWGAVLLVLLRVCQGIAVGGEWGGASLMALEHAEKSKRGFAASFTNAGAPTGAALGTFIFGFLSSVLSTDQFFAWGWRIAFLVSIVLLIVGLIVRSKIAESPIFEAAIAREKAEDAKPKPPLWQILRRPKALLLTMFGGAAAFGLQVVLPTFSISYAADSGVQRSTVLYAFAIASVISIFFVVYFGRVSDHFGRRPVMIVGLILMAAFMYPLFMMLKTGSFPIILAGYTLVLAFHGLVYGPLAAFISEQFGATARYTGASLGYQLATLLGGGFTPTLVASIYGMSGGTTVVPIVLFLGAMTLVSIIAILLTRESKDHDLLTYEH